MRGRRWGDWVDTDGTMSVADRTRRAVVWAWPFAASVAVIAVVLAATIVSVRAIRERDRFAALAVEVKRSADNAAEASAGNRSLLEQAKPCLPADPPESPSCQRKAAADAYVADILTSLAAGIAAHDANVNRQLDALRARLGVTTPPPARTPITARARTTTTAPRAPAPATTTTTSCPRLPNGRCRP